LSKLTELEKKEIKDMFSVTWAMLLKRKEKDNKRGK
jgi:hypothetical protein